MTKTERLRKEVKTKNTSKALKPNQLQMNDYVAGIKQITNLK